MEAGGSGVESLFNYIVSSRATCISKKQAASHLPLKIEENIIFVVKNFSVAHSVCVLNSFEDLVNTIWIQFNLLNKNWYMLWHHSKL